MDLQIVITLPGNLPVESLKIQRLRIRKDLRRPE